MKKITSFISIALALFIAGSVSAQSMPSCSEGSHYEGNYVETETCNRVCTRQFFGICFKYDNVCTTSGSWVGSCVANPVEEVVDEVVVEDETTTEEVIEEVIEEKIYPNNSFQVLFPKVAHENYLISAEGRTLNVNFMTNFSTEGKVSVISENGNEQIFLEGAEHTYRQMKIELDPGYYKVQAFADSSNGRVFGGFQFVTIE